MELKLNKQGLAKYKGAFIRYIPSDKFPHLVQIEKTTRKLKALKDKKFINDVKAIIAIDKLSAELLINGGKKTVVKDLVNLGLGQDK